jgi:glycosyltransferase involved in cell wall biosynthesis
MMTAAPLVSIVTPWYNHGRFAQEYFEGLLAQTYRNLEILIVDDGSTDDSWPVIQTWGRRLARVFPRVMVRRHANRGAPRTMDGLLDRVTGKYVCILESDDYYLPRKIEWNVEYLESHPDVGLVHSSAETVRGAGVSPGVNSYRGDRIPTGEVLLDLLVQCNFLFTCTACMRTELVRGQISLAQYAALGYRMGDYPMWLDLARRTNFGYIAAPLARYRVLEESYSHSRSRTKVFLFKKSFHQIRLDYIEKNLDRVKADKAAFEQLLQEFVSIVYWLREGWDYAGSGRFLAQMLRIWGYKRIVLTTLAKLFPHLLFSLSTKRAAQNGFSRLY